MKRDVQCCFRYATCPQCVCMCVCMSPTQILEALGSSSQWDFDIVKLESISNHE